MGTVQDALVVAGAQQSDLIGILQALEDESIGHKGEEDASGPFTELNPAILGEPPYGLNIKRCNIVKKAIKHAQGLSQSLDQKDSALAISDAIIMEGKTVQIKLDGNTETASAPMQRSLYRRREDDESLFMPDGLPAGRLWLTDIDDLVETSRAAIRVLHNSKDAHQAPPEVPGKTPDGLSTELFPVGSTVEVFPFVGQCGLSLSMIWQWWRS
ncbi:hypothetical protein ABBQ38_013054 [Trebouxia sp. C0009 RCD-2024]